MELILKGYTRSQAGNYAITRKIFDLMIRVMLRNFVGNEIINSIR